MTIWTREDVEGTPAITRPTVRVLCDGTPGLASVVVDGNNPWLVLRREGKSVEFRASWGLVLGVINDSRESPVTIR